MAAAALAMYGVWAALAFGWRTVVQRRRTGDTGLRLHAPRGTVQWWAKLGFVSAILTGLAAPVASLTGLDDVQPLDDGAVHAIGVAIAAVGIALTFVAQLSMGDSWRIGVDAEERTTLVQRGAFAVVRNPIFTAMLLTALGLTLMVPNAIALIGFAVLVVALEAQVRLVEEPYLQATHGDAYVAYASRVGRFLPNVGRLS